MFHIGFHWFQILLNVCLVATWISMFYFWTRFRFLNVRFSDPHCISNTTCWCHWFQSESASESDNINKAAASISASDNMSMYRCVSVDDRNMSFQLTGVPCFSNPEKISYDFGKSLKLERNVQLRSNYWTPDNRKLPTCTFGCQISYSWVICWQP